MSLNKLWWVRWEEWESGECYTTRWTRKLVCANTEKRAIELVVEQGVPNWLVGEEHFDQPDAVPFIIPKEEGVY